MSKRNSTGSSNTLFNYFTKTPPANKKLKNGGHAENSPKLDSSTIKGEKELKTEIVDQYNDSDDDVPIAPSKKRKRIRLSPVDSDDSDAENMEDTAVTADEGTWIHCKLDWLKADKIKDAQKRRPDHPEYDPRTVHGEFAHSGFPESAYGRMASTLVAKGYKVVRREICQVTLRGTQVCGLQDAGPGEAAASYLLAIAEEVTFMCVTANKNSKFDKVVRREICQVTLRGTQVCGLQDAGPGEAAAAYLLAIAEEVTFMCVTANKNSKFDKVVRREICQVTLRGTQVCGLQDAGPGEAAAAYLLAIAEEVVYDRKTSSLRTSKLVGSHCHNARREPISMWTPESTLKTLAEKYYRTNAEGERRIRADSGGAQPPRGPSPGRLRLLPLRLPARHTDARHGAVQQLRTPRRAEQDPIAGAEGGESLGGRRHHGARCDHAQKPQDCAG
ncbi:putative DNA mismatch repair protein muts [Operophtera brumata]|uniref:Putative DNA mismatch repair protein muts n=1 Tax=Operophtera brumata TaxID=104452 RepID=A0A0L7LNA4_OPEBR|nr:putative DNA mismatch repair protein muts [Operophtera brumata]